MLRRCMQAAIFLNYDMADYVLHSRGLFRLAGKAWECAIGVLIVKQERQLFRSTTDDV